MKAVISALALAVLSSQVSAAPVSLDGTIVEPLLFDGRIRPLYRSASFDNSSTSAYNPEYILGSEPFSKIIKFPNVETSLFDKPIKGKSLTITINDKSIFAPGGPQNAQTGFRRSELLPNVNSGTDATVNGKTAHHFSVRFDPTRPLNYTHQYEPVFIETNDYSSHVWTLKTGTPFGQTWTEAEAETLRIMSSTTSAPETTLFSVPFSRGWHNFAVEQDWVNNMITVYYSYGQDALELVAGPVANDGSGKGQFHAGLLKLPWSAETNIDVTRAGYQKKRINEGLTYGGIFIENTATIGVTRA